MANKLAGQKAKFTKALAEYNRTDEDEPKVGPARRMAEVIRQAPESGFSENDVTGGRDVPDDVRRLLVNGEISAESSIEDPEHLVELLQEMVDTSDRREEGHGNQYIYAYGYRCAPDRLKVGRADRDVVDRITQQIATSTPDKPSLFLIIRTSDCRALEMAIHGILRLRNKKIVGGGAEWFLTSRDELLEIYTNSILGKGHPAGNDPEFPA